VPRFEKGGFRPEAVSPVVSASAVGDGPTGTLAASPCTNQDFCTKLKLLINFGFPCAEYMCIIGA